MRTNKSIYNKGERNAFRKLINNIVDFILIRGKNKSLLVPIDSFMSVLKMRTFGKCPFCKNEINRDLNFKPLDENVIECTSCNTKIYTSSMTVFLN